MVRPYVPSVCFCVLGFFPSLRHGLVRCLDPEAILMAGGKNGDMLRNSGGIFSELLRRILFYFFFAIINL